MGKRRRRRKEGGKVFDNAGLRSESRTQRRKETLQLYHFRDNKLTFPSTTVYRRAEKEEGRKKLHAGGNSTQERRDYGTA